MMKNSAFCLPAPSYFCINVCRTVRYEPFIIKPISIEILLVHRGQYGRHPISVAVEVSHHLLKSSSFAVPRKLLRIAIAPCAVSAPLAEPLIYSEEQEPYHGIPRREMSLENGVVSVMPFLMSLSLTGEKHIKHSCLSTYLSDFHH